MSGSPVKVPLCVKEEFSKLNGMVGWGIKSIKKGKKPKIQADGGDIELVAIENGTVKGRLQGHTQAAQWPR